MSNVKISAAIIARNESENIPDAIKSLDFVDQIVVADTGSADDTMEIARNLGAEVHRVEFEGFGKTKNKALGYCSGDWILFIDADERVTPELAKQIKNIDCSNNAPAGFEINRLTYFLGKPIRHSGWYPDYILRFFKRGNGRFTSNLVHEQVAVEGPVHKLDGLLLHYSYKDIEQYLDKMNEYSSLSAREMHEKGKRFNPLDPLIRPGLIFIKMFIFKAGFLDGFHGFILAVLSSYHVFIKYIKLFRLRTKQ
jgi:glycosyltransferase involved in cell wall biosynthesis